ncbi:replication-relaxation family protein [Streptomyces kaniharaensis]|uniref:replication-relaxation family protein n=1 Tax=Streptomyces kaniharaensis TaxID=212423 RepID=UPI0018A83335|nr:replication-relaxation family protein [Streptomyces kaniharaensis]
MTTTSPAAPDPDDGDQAADHHQVDRAAKASPDGGKGPGAASVGTSAGTSTPLSVAWPVSAGQRPRSRGRGRGDNPLPPAAEVRWKSGSTEPVRKGVMVSLALFQRATGRELWHLVLPRQRNDRATRDALGDLQAAGRVREELRLPDNRKLWCLTAAGRREAAGLLPAGAKLSALRPERDGPGTAFSEHALDVVATAGLLARAGIGYLEAFSTEVEHAIPHRRSLFTDLVLRDPGAKVPVLLVEVDRENEGVGTLVEKLTSYRAWCELPAKAAAKAAFEASLRRAGTRTHGLRLWPTVYPPTGREGLPPVALVFEAGRKRTRPGTKPLTPEQKKEKEKADHLRLLRRIQAVEAASEDAWYAPPYRGDNITARNYHHALPVVATTLPLLCRFGAGAPWHRFGRDGWYTLTNALDNPDGDELLRAEQAAADQARQEREQERQKAERARRRPACTRCKAPFSDERWAERERAAWGDDGLCAGCRQAAADRKAREEAERERAAAQAAAAEAKRRGSWWRRS